MNRIFVTVLFVPMFCLLQLPVSAQPVLSNLEVQTRFDFYGDAAGDDVTPAFGGKYLNLYLAGNLGDKLGYSIRQRFNKAVVSGAYWDATDWAWVDWAFNDVFSVNAGKQVVAIGGFEYDRAPINLYQCSEYWNNIACYQFGASASARLGTHDKLTFQLCQSPNRTAADGLFAYNLIWYGDHGPWSTIYSVNMIESLPGEFISYVALGNRLEFGPCAIEADWMNRAAAGQKSFFSDFSVMAEFSVRPADNLNLFLKYSYDANEETALDFCVLPGTSITSVGGGLEFYPLRGSRALRLHAQGYGTYGSNGNPQGVLSDGHVVLDCGLTFYLDLLKAILR